MPETTNAEIAFVNAGESLPGSNGDPSVIHFDTGGGQFDQHHLGDVETSSAALLAEKLSVAQDPGLKELLLMVKRTDNVRPVEHTNLHYLIEGYPRLKKFQTEGRIDWGKVQERIFDDFDIIYGQETQRTQSRRDLQKYARWTILPNELKVATILWHPELREAAFERGADVVLWTRAKGRNKFYVGIQRHRKLKGLLSLRGVAVNLRAAEASIREIKVRRENLGYVGREGPVSNWLLHQSFGLVASGTKSWKLESDEYTKIHPQDLTTFTCVPLSAIPADQIGKWRRQEPRAT
ncbi:MAG: hypothetical protein HYS60_02720 [Candidatus Wildermuthbacteria bacterium]|nr:hypothetical protein [Candidatus Wildermuthbacteria bacterium]